MFLWKIKHSRTTKVVATVLAIAGTISLAIIIVIALRAPERKRTLSSQDVSTLSPGRLMKWDTEALRYFAVRPVEGELYILAVPKHPGGVPMPETHWWTPKMHCQDFDTDPKGGVITAQSRFRCHDSEQPQEWSARWQWDARGKHIPDAANTVVDDMFRVKFARSDDEIVVVALEAD